MHRIEEGWQFIAIGSELKMMLDGAADVVQKLGPKGQAETWRSIDPVRERSPMSPPPLPDWQMPPGVNRGPRDYLHDPAVARNYDAGLAGVSLPDVDARFVEEHCPRPGWVVDLGCGTAGCSSRSPAAAIPSSASICPEKC